MEAKEKIDLIKAKIDIAKSKLMAFLAIAGGSWIYGLNWRLFKLGKFEQELKEIENG